MTVSSSSNKVTLNGNGATTVWPFSFRIFEASDLQVYTTDLNGVQTLLSSSAYSVTINGESGGSVTYPLSGAPLATNNTLTMARATPLTQPVDFTSQGAFLPQNHEDADDRAMMAIQELSEQVDRCVKLQITDVSGTDPILPDLTDLSGAVLYVEGGEIKASSSATLDNIGDISAIVDAIETVDGISSEVVTVAGISGGVQTVASNVADVSNYADTYYGPSATAPLARKDTTPLQEGDMYFDTVADKMYVYTGSAWQPTTETSASATPGSDTGDNSTVTFTLPATPISEDVVLVFLDGVRQAVSAYSVSGDQITFSVAPGTGVAIDYLVLGIASAGASSITDGDFSANGLMTRTADGVYTSRTLQGSSGLSVTNGNGVSDNPTIAYDWPSLTEDTSPDVAADFVAIYDDSAGGYKKLLLTNIPTTTDIAGATAETTPDPAADYLLMYDDSATENRKLLIDNLPKVVDISGLTADASPDGAADFVAVYDDSAGVNKKVLLNNLPGGGGGGSGDVDSVADYTALKAVTVGASNVIVVRDEKRGGVFVWDGSDLSGTGTGEVPNDTSQGIFVPPDSDTTGASGAWVRQFVEGEVSVDWFGAAGDGTTNDYTAIQAAVNWIASTTNKKRGGTVLIPARVYLTNSTILLDDVGVALKGVGYISLSTTGTTTDIDGPVLRRGGSSGPVVHLNASDTRLENVTIDAAKAYRGVSIVNTTQLTNCGVLVETDDSTAQVKHVTVKDVVVRQQPADGFHFAGDLFNIDVENCVAISCMRHGFVADAGYLTGRTTKKRPGAINIENCRAQDCAGHGIAWGHPSQGSALPLRAFIKNFETFRCAVDTSVRHGAYGSWFYGEEIFVVSTAFAGTTAKSNATASISASSSTVTVSSSFFDTGDNSRVVRIAGAGAGGSDLVTTISSGAGGTTATLNDSAETTVSGATVEVWSGNDPDIGAVHLAGRDIQVLNTRYISAGGSQHVAIESVAGVNTRSVRIEGGHASSSSAPTNFASLGTPLRGVRILNVSGDFTNIVDTTSEVGAVRKDIVTSPALATSTDNADYVTSYYNMTVAFGDASVTGISGVFDPANVAITGGTIEGISNLDVALASGEDVDITTNDSNVSGQLTLLQSGDGDATARFTIGTTNWSFGIDNSDADCFAVQRNTSLNASKQLALYDGAASRTTISSVPTVHSTLKGDHAFELDASQYMWAIENGTGTTSQIWVWNQGTGDASINFSVGSTPSATWAIGVDNSISDQFAINNSTSVDGSSPFIITTAGKVDLTGASELDVTGVTVTGLAGSGGFLNVGDKSTKVISGGTITATNSFHDVDTEGAAASDNLDNITATTAGDLLYLQQENSGRVVTVRHNAGGTGNIRLLDETDFVLGHDVAGNADTRTKLVLMCDGTRWEELYRAQFP